MYLQIFVLSVVLACIPMGLHIIEEGYVGVYYRVSCCRQQREGEKGGKETRKEDGENISHSDRLFPLCLLPSALCTISDRRCVCAARALSLS